MLTVVLFVPLDLGRAGETTGSRRGPEGRPRSGVALTPAPIGAGFG